METRQIWSVRVETENKCDRVVEFFPCATREVAIQFFKRYTTFAIDSLNNWSGNDFVIEIDSDDRFLGHCNNFGNWFDVQMFEQTLLTEKDLGINRYDRKWHIADEDYNLYDEIWWSVCKINNDHIYCNNVIGMLLLVTEDGEKWESPI